MKGTGEKERETLCDYMFLYCKLFFSKLFVGNYFANFLVKLGTASWPIRYSELVIITDQKQIIVSLFHIWYMFAQ